MTKNSITYTKTIFKLYTQKENMYHHSNKKHLNKSNKKNTI